MKTLGVTSVAVVILVACGSSGSDSNPPNDSEPDAANRADTAPSPSYDAGADANGNSSDADAGSPAAMPVTTITSGANHNCAILDDHSLKCWGDNFSGQLGLGDSNARGDQSGEMGSVLPTVDLGVGRTALSIAAGQDFGCAILDDHSVKCWGGNGTGSLGLGDTNDRGDGPGQMGGSLAVVDLGAGRTARAIAAGAGGHACAILDNYAVKCWGNNLHGELGLGDKNNRGDGPGEMGDALPAVDLGPGRTALSIAAGESHTCAILDDHSVKCWGDGSYGGLGLGDKNGRGDGPGEMGAALPSVDLGAGRTALAITAGGGHTCAILDDRSVKCWGYNTSSGQLGLGDTNVRGDGAGEMGNALPSVDLGAGRTALAISAGDRHTCAILDDHSVKCWGENFEGQLGLGDISDRGDKAGEMGSALPSVDLGAGRTALAINTGDEHTCAILDDHSVKCWGLGSHGQLALGDKSSRGDQASEMGNSLGVVDFGPGRTALVSP